MIFKYILGCYDKLILLNFERIEEKCCIICYSSTCKRCFNFKNLKIENSDKINFAGDRASIEMHAIWSVWRHK